MRRSLTALLLCFQFLMLGSAQQPLTPAPAPKTLPQAPQTKTENQKPQPADDLDIVKITTNLVQIDAIVTDSNGKRVRDLRPDEVEMLEDGKAQNITNFSYINLESRKATNKSQPAKAVDPNVPLPPTKLRPEQVRRTFALVVDDLGLSFESAYYVRRALKKFVDEQMQPDDLIAIIRTGGGVGALQQFTTDKRQLYAAIEKVKWNPIGRASIGAFAPIGTDPNLAARNPENDLRTTDDMEQFREDIFAVGTLGALNYVVRGLKELPGRKSVVLFTDGIQIFSSKDFSSNVRVYSALHRLVDLANRASVVVYTVDARGLQALHVTAADFVTNPGDIERLMVERRMKFYDSQIGLDYLSSRTGGLAFKNRNFLDKIVKEILEDQEGYYLIGYRPDDATFSPVAGRFKFHDISLKVKRPGKFTVRMRNGFYGVSNENIRTAALTPQEQMVSALTSPFAVSGVQMKLTSLFVNDAKVGSAMRSILHVNTKDIGFEQEPDGMYKAVVDVMAMAFGDNGMVVDQFSYIQTLRVKKENFNRAVRNGITYYATIPIKKSGAYQFRIALRDRASGRVGSATQFIEVPDIKKDKLLVSGIVMKGMTLETYMRNTSAEAPDTKSEVVGVENLPTASPALRQFQNGMALAYAFSIYNAQIDKATGKPRLKVQVRVFRNGEALFTGDAIDYDPNEQKDLKRLIATGGVQLGSNMPPGEYVLQVIVTDAVKAKPRVASQWLDFEIVN